jgi:hypothetical protein
MICTCIICIQNVVFLSLLRAGAETLAHPGLDPFNVLTKKNTVLVLSRTGINRHKIRIRHCWSGLEKAAMGINGDLANSSGVWL